MADPLVLVAVVWDDAHRTTEDVTAFDFPHKPARYTSIGLLLRSDERGVSIAGELCEDGRFRDVDFIPRAMIVEEYEIGPLKPKRVRAPRPRLGPAPPHPAS